MLTLGIISASIAWAGMSSYGACKLHKSFKLFQIKHFMTDARHLSELPSVSVCIPARNETNAMTRCLESVIASRYPKLEIIVLDDESIDNTSYLIKSFAHAGVRFVKGSPLPDGWLGKNHALDMLLREASGSYVMFMDVDTEIKPDTVGLLMSYIHSESAGMVSVLPRRLDGWRSSVLMSSMRYFWELTMHSRQTPASASAAWLVDRDDLLNAGGFSQFSNHAQPEAYLAHHYATSRRYKFLISSNLLGVSFEKKWQSQCETARRLLYPKFGGQVSVVLLKVVLLLFMFTPVWLIIIGLISSQLSAALIGLAQWLITALVYGYYTNRIWRSGWWIGALLWPIVLAQEIGLLIASVYAHKTGRLTWKGRPIGNIISSSKPVS